MACVSVGISLLDGLIETAVEPARHHVDPDEHRDINLISALLLDLQLIHHRDSGSAEHEIDPDASKQG